MTEGTVAAPQPGSRHREPPVADDPRWHPRPSLTRPDWQPLDGEWEFGSGPSAGGPSLGGRILVPFAPESPASGAEAPRPGEAVWYRRTLELPPAWRGRRVFLRFNAADWETTLWVAGQRVAQHEGGYTPFGVDVTDLVQDGQAELLVRCLDDPHDMSKPRGKQDWLPEPHSIWYPRTTGIWQTVWWEALPETRVERVAFAADLAAFALDMELRLAGLLSAAGRPAGGIGAPSGLEARVRLELRGEVLVEDTYAVTGGALRRRLHLPDPGIDDARARFLWTPETPNLIDVTVTLFRHGEVLDVARTRTALRTVEARDGAVLLNGRPYRLRMALDQGYWEPTHLTPPDVDALRLDVELAKALGFNGVRKHQKLEDPRYYAWADHLGLLVWVELPSAYAFDATSVRRLTQTWMAAVEQASPHPSVMAWVPFNESWGVPDLPLSPAQRAFVRGLADLTRALDPSRPVVGNDGWEVLATDLVNVHDYAADPEVLAARYATPEAVERALLEHRPGGRRLLLEEALPGDRPVLLSEFGGVRVDDGAPGWGYDAVPDGAALLERYRRLAAAANGAALAGWCYTQLTDTFQERNGLLAMDRTPKADPMAIARATRGEPETASSGTATHHAREERRAADGRQEEDA